MADIFISYVREDQVRIQPIVRALETDFRLLQICGAISGGQLVICNAEVVTVNDGTKFPKNCPGSDTGRHQVNSM